MLSSQFENILLEYKQDITVKKMGGQLIDRLGQDIAAHPHRDLVTTDTAKIIEALDKAQEGLQVVNAKLEHDTSERDPNDKAKLETQKEKLEEKILILNNQFAVNILKGLKESDPTKNKQYVQWLARTYIKNPTMHSMEDILSTIKDYLEKFHKLKIKNHLAPEYRDINSFKSFDNFMDELDNYSSELIDDEGTGKKEIYKHDRVYDENGLLVIHPLDRKAACHYGRGTRWCTSGKNNNFFASYNKRGNLYMVIPRKPGHVGEKYQFHFEDNAFFDEKDHSLSDSELFNLTTKYPEIKKVPVFKKHADENGLLWLQEPKKTYKGSNFTVEEYRKDNKPYYLMKDTEGGDEDIYFLSKKGDSDIYTIEQFSNSSYSYTPQKLNPIEEHNFLEKYPELVSKFALDGSYIQKDPKRSTTKAGSDVDQHSSTSIMTDKKTGHKTSINLQDFDISEYSPSRVDRDTDGPLEVLQTNPFAVGTKKSKDKKYASINPYELTLDHPELIDMFKERIQKIIDKAMQQALLLDGGRAYDTKEKREALESRLYRAVAPLLPYKVYNKNDVLVKRHTTPKGQVVVDYVVPKDENNPNVSIIKRDTKGDIASIHVVEPKKLHAFANGDSDDYLAKTTTGKIYGDVKTDTKLRRMYNDKVLSNKKGLGFLPSVGYLNQNPTLLDLYKDTKMATPKTHDKSNAIIKDYGKTAYVDDTRSYNKDEELKTLRNYIVNPKDSEDGESYAISWSPEKPQYVEVYHITKNGQQHPLKDWQNMSHVLKMFPEIRKIHMKDWENMRKKNPEYEPLRHGEGRGYRREDYVPDWDFAPTEIVENDRVKIEQFGPNPNDAFSLPNFQVVPKQKNPFGQLGDRYFVSLQTKDARGSVGKVGTMNIKRYGKSTHVNMPVDAYGNPEENNPRERPMSQDEKFTPADTKSVPNITTMSVKDELDFFKYYPELRRLIKEENIHKKFSPASLAVPPPDESEENATITQYSNFKLDTVPIEDPVVTKQYIIPNEEEYDDEFYTLYTYDPTWLINNPAKVPSYVQSDKKVIPHGVTQLVKGEQDESRRNYYQRSQSNDNSSAFREAYKGRHTGTISPNTPEYNKLMQRFPELSQLMAEKGEEVGDIRTQNISEDNITILGPERVYSFNNSDGSKRYIITPVSNPVRGQHGDIKDLHDTDSSHSNPNVRVSRVAHYRKHDERTLAGGEEDWDQDEVKWNRDSYEINFESTANNKLLNVPLLVNPFAGRVENQITNSKITKDDGEEVVDPSFKDDAIKSFNPLQGRGEQEFDHAVDEANKNPELFSWLQEKAEEANANTSGIGMFINFLPVTTDQLTAEQLEMPKVHGIDIVGIGKLGIKNPIYFWQGREQAFNKIAQKTQDDYSTYGNTNNRKYKDALLGDTEPADTERMLTDRGYHQKKAKNKLIAIKPESGSKFMDYGNAGYGDRISGLMHQLPSAKFIDLAKELPNVNKIATTKELKKIGMIPNRTWGPIQVKRLGAEPAIKNNGKPWIKSIEEFIEPDGIGFDHAGYGDDAPSKLLGPGTGYVITLNNISDVRPKSKKKVRDPETGMTKLVKQPSPGAIISNISRGIDLPWNFKREVLDSGNGKDNSFMVYFANNRVAYILNTDVQNIEKYNLSQEQKKALFFDDEAGLFPELKPLFDKYAKSNKWMRENQLHTIISKVLFESLGDKAYWELKKEKPAKQNFGQLVFLKNIRLTGSYNNAKLKELGFFMKNGEWVIQKPKYDKLVGDGKLREMSINRPLLTGKNKIPNVGKKKVEEGKKFPRTSEFLYQKVDEVEDIKRLSGVYDNYQIPVHVEGATTATASMGSNISQTASQISKIMKEKNIQPGTPEWFQLWFSKPYLTGEKPTGDSK